MNPPPVVAAHANHAIDHSRGTVHIYSRGASRPTRVLDCLRGDNPVTFHDFATPPAEADYYVVSALTKQIELEAARLHAIPVILPAAHAWLATRIDVDTRSGWDVTICMRRPPV